MVRSRRSVPLTQQIQSVRAAERRLRDALTDAEGPLAPAELFESLSGVTVGSVELGRRSVRRAIWNLVDQNEAAFDERRRVVAGPALSTDG